MTERQQDSHPSFDPRFLWMQESLDALHRADLYRELRARDTHPTRAAGGILSLCSNDYLGLAMDPRVIAGAQAALNTYGAGSGSSRLIAGELTLYRELELALAEWLGFEDALLFNTGYHANLGILQVVPGRGGHVLSDAYNHASIIDGCRLSRASVTVVPHNDLAAVRADLARDTAERGPLARGESAIRSPAVVVTEGMFSMDGDLAPVAELRAVVLEHNALLVVDDAHSLGCLGEGGRGIAWAGVSGGGADIYIGTFGKALGSAGAFVAGPAVLREALINTSRTFIYTTGPGPAAVGAALAALRIVQTDPEPMLRLQANCRQVRAGLIAQGFNLGRSQGHIIPLVVGSAERALAFSQALLARGLDVRAIRPPTVPEGTCRLRLSLSAAHSPQQLEWAVGLIGEEGRRLGVVR